MEPTGLTLPREAPQMVVAIGASAGGLEALERFFDHAPQGLGIAYIVIQHLSPDHKSMMAALLSRHTAMSVVTATEGMILQADRVHLIPPGMMMRLDGQVLRLTPKSTRGLSLPIDLFFASAAQSWGARVVGIILSGTGTDGTRGIGAIHEEGGLVGVQDPENARFDGMPVSAIATGLVDCQRSAEGLAHWLEEILSSGVYPPQAPVHDEDSPPASDDPLSDILELLSLSSRISFGDYKMGTVRRRLERRMALVQCATFDSYLNHLRKNPAEVILLRREMLVPVTRFFRDSDSFEALAEPMEELVRAAHLRRSPLRIWSAACATGEEAYSLAILAHETCNRLSVWPGIKVFSTDVEQAYIDQASQGIYPESAVDEIPPDLLDRYFERRDGRVLVRPELRQCMVFAKHNLLADPPFTRIDLVSCRNMLIYLQPHGQERAMRRLQYALRVEGVLFLGSSEMAAAGSADFAPISTVHRLWRLLRTAGRVMLYDGRAERGAARPVAGRPRALSGLVAEAGPADQALAALLKAYAPPPAVLVDQANQVVHSYGDVGRYLVLRSGVPSLDLARLMPEPLLPVARALLYRASRDLSENGETLISDYVTIDLLRGSEMVARRVRLVVMPVGEGDLHRLLVFEEEEHISASRHPESDAQSVHLSDEMAGRIEMLEQELHATRESLRVTIEEMEASSEELQATNEEMMASNEELQSANEELQSVNEELNTVNAEFQEKIEILNRVNVDLETLARVVPAGSIFVDGQKCVTRFSPDAAQIFRLRDIDIGRPIADLNHSLDYPDLIADLTKAIANNEQCEREVQGSGERRFLVRIMPYRLPSSDGRAAVLSVVDVTQSHMLQRLQAILDSMPSSVAVVDGEGKIRMVNARWCRFAQENGLKDLTSAGPGADYLAACLPQVAGQKDDVAVAAAKGLRRVLAGEKSEFQFQYPCDAPDQKRWFLLHAHRLSADFGGAVISHIDVSRWKYPEA
jgi:two-component system CheB/CheR fusion protein